MSNNWVAVSRKVLVYKDYTVLEISSGVDFTLLALSLWCALLKQYSVNHGFIVTMKQKTPNGKRTRSKSSPAFPSAEYTSKSTTPCAQQIFHSWCRIDLNFFMFSFCFN